MAPSALTTGEFEIGDLLRLARQDAGRSLRQVADRAGVGRSSLSRWERGRTVPGKDELDRLLGVLQVAVPDAIGANVVAAKAKDDDGKLSRSRRMLFRAIRMRSGYPLTAAAKLLGVSKGTLSRWESGDRWPGRERLSEAARALGGSEREAEAIAGEGPLTQFAAPRSAADPEQIRQLRAGIASGLGRESDLEFLSLDESLSATCDAVSLALRLELRAAYIQWLGWWYRDEEAGLLACKLLPKLGDHARLPIWGRVLRAACNYHTEVRRDPLASLEVMERSLPRLLRAPSEGFVRRELAGALLSFGEFKQAGEMLCHARDAGVGEEQPETHQYCCDLVEAGLWSNLRNHDRAVGLLREPTEPDPYLVASSAVGRYSVLKAAGQGRDARSQLETALVLVAGRGFPHLTRGLNRRLNES